VMNTTITGFALIGVGALTMICAALNWRIVSRPGKLLNRVLGDSMARLLYFIGGGFVFLMGIGKLIGMN